MSNPEAERLDTLRSTVLAAGANTLPRPPWRAGSRPPTDTDLVQFVAWRSGGSETATDPEVVAAGLGLIAAARTELDQLETGLVFAARAEGLTWSRIAAAMGLGSAQAAQQRSERIGARTR